MLWLLIFTIIATDASGTAVASQTRVQTHLTQQACEAAKVALVAEVRPAVRPGQYVAIGCNSVKLPGTV